MNPVTRAIRRFCLTTCRREACAGCVFEAWSARRRQLQLFLDRRGEAAEARRPTAGAAR